MKLEDYIERHARLHADKMAVVSENRQLSYSELWQLVSARAANYRRGQAVVFRASQDIDFLVTYFAIHLAGGIAVPLGSDAPDHLLAQTARSLAGHPIPEDTADVLFTTGTTGHSKGVMVSHRAILADAENLIEGQHFCHELVFIVSGPLNHIGSLSKLYPVMMLGATVYLLEGMKDLGRFFHALDFPCQKMATFLVPASVRILTQLCGNKLAAYAHKIDFIESGGAPLPHTDMQALCRLLPKSRLYNTYASTETGIVSTYNYNDGRCLAGCLGRPMSHSRIVITKEGKIACQGNTLMSGYVGDALLTATVLRDDTVYMSDYGSIDGEGMLHIGGRETDVINIGGYKVSPVEVEEAALAMPGVKDCVCIAVPHKITGNALKLMVVMTAKESFDKRKMALFLKSKLETYKVPMLYELVDAVKRTYNGKIDRKAYS